MNAILLHVPMGFSKENWHHNYINIMPAGLFSLAHFANSCGHDVKVMNSAALQNQTKALDTIYRRIQEHHAQVVGLPIHWHYSGFDVCWVASRLKEKFPHLKIILGGITATFFPKEFLQACPALDAVVSGDGELPFTNYLSQIEKIEAERDLSLVPNLTWRRPDGALISNPHTYVATEEQYSSFDFNFSDVMFDTTEYVNGSGMLEVVAGVGRDVSQEKLEDKALLLNVGRGCNLNCVYCCGSHVFFSQYFKRPKVMLRSVDSILATVRDAVNNGLKKIHICFDPPLKHKDQHFISLFTRMRDEIADDLELMFEVYNLPSDEFIAACTQSFKHAIIAISPCFFDEKKMPERKGYHFTRAELEACLAKIAKYKNLSAFVFFAITPLEQWSDDDIRERVGYMKYLRENYRSRASAMPILAEPGSPWVSFPEATVAKGFSLPLTFDDFWAEWQKPLNRWSEKLSGLPLINEINEKIYQQMQQDSLNANRN